jgi:hypothetical protein
MQLFHCYWEPYAALSKAQAIQRMPHERQIATLLIFARVYAIASVYAVTCWTTLSEYAMIHNEDATDSTAQTLERLFQSCDIPKRRQPDLATNCGLQDSGLSGPRRRVLCCER